MSSKLSEEVAVPMGKALASGRQLSPATIGLLAVNLFCACSGAVGPGTGSDDTGDDGDTPTPPALECESKPSISAARWRRLTSEQYANSVRDLLGEKPNVAAFTPDTRTGPFKTNTLLPVQENDVGAYDTISQAAAAKAVGNLSKLLDCDVKAKGEDACAKQFIKSFGARAYRRPLTADEENALSAVYSVGKEESFSLGIQSVVEAALSSPNFLYLVEVGEPADNGLRKLTGFEIASRLSYVLTGTMPDSELFSEAENGSLDTAEGVRAYAEKLLASDKSLSSIQGFHTELLGVDSVQGPQVSKNGKYAAAFDDSMRASMASEPAEYVKHIMTKRGGSVKEMLSSPYVGASGPLTKIYGDSLSSTSDGVGLVDNGTRRGLLTLASVLTVHPKIPTPRGAVYRGKMVRQSFLCQDVPSPNVMVDFSLPPDADKKTAQELLRDHQDNPSCKGCHQLMDSIGFGLESYDPLGAYREKDNGGNTIDSSGEIVDLASDGTFKNAGEMADKLAEAPEVRTCMSKQWLRFALGHDPDEEEDRCSLAQVDEVLLKGDGDIKEAILALVTSNAFRFYRGQ